MTTASVLVVERDILVRQPLAQYLRECGYRVYEALSYDEARTCLARYRDAIGVALIDVRGPSADGFALSVWMKTNCPDVRILLGATVARVLALAGNLCDDASALPRKPDYRPVLDRIKRLLASRRQPTDPIE